MSSEDDLIAAVEKHLKKLQEGNAMSEDINYTCLFDGTKQSIDEALRCVEKLQNANEAYSGKGHCDFNNEPEISKDGLSFKWYYYSFHYQDSMGKFDKKTKKLTKDGSLRIWRNTDSTDGDSWNKLLLIENGKKTESTKHGAAIGLKAAMAARRLESDVSPQAADYLALAERFETAWGDGWDEDDLEWFPTASVLVGLMERSITKHSQLMRAAAVKKSLLSMHSSGQLKSIQEDIKKFTTDKALAHSAASLIAMAESVEIGKSATKPKKRIAKTGASKSNIL